MFTHTEAMLPILQCLSAGEERKHIEIANAVANHFNLSEEEKKEVLPSGRLPRYRSRTSWGLHSLLHAAYVERTRRGIYKILPAGLSVLETGAKTLDDDYLLQNSDEFKAWTKKCDEQRRTRSQNATEDSKPPLEPTDTGNPREVIEQAVSTLDAQLATEILEQIMHCSPDFFEDLVVDLLVAMGYGGSVKDAAQSVGKSGDGGIDGIIKEDRLGLDAIYIQAKRWEGTVGRPEIQQFVGAIANHRARKGVFLTTSSFSAQAHEYVKNIEQRVILIDGAKLAEYMIELNLGVNVENTHHIKQLDSDFFDE